MASDSESGSSPTATPSPEQIRPPPRSARNDDDRSARSNVTKRKRTDTSAAADSSNSRRRRTREPSPSEDEEASDTVEEAIEGTEGAFGEGAYDPDQPMQVRRQIQRGYRTLLRHINDNADEFLSAKSTGVRDTYLKANELMEEVRQTTEATIDSHLLVTTADLSYRRVVRITREDASLEGVDLDEFVSKCATYMTHGRGFRSDDAPELSSTQRQRRHRARPAADDSDGDGGGDGDEDDGNMLQWAHLGQYAGLPPSRRPGVAGFLVGPLSAEKKVRKVTQRTARLRPDDLVETRPEVLRLEDLAKKENDLTVLCSKILQRLRQVQQAAQQTVKDLIYQQDNMAKNEKVRLMLEHGLRQTGGIDFMRFVINPRSFGQSVENMFFVSFLIRDGHVKIALDDDGLPSIEPVDSVAREENEPRQHESSKHQAIFSMDMETWQDIIDTFNIKMSLIEHRKSQTEDAPGTRGWYS